MDFSVHRTTALLHAVSAWGQLFFSSQPPAGRCFLAVDLGHAAPARMKRLQWYPLLHLAKWNTTGTAPGLSPVVPQPLEIVC